MRAPRLRVERTPVPGLLRPTGELDRSNAAVLLEAVRLASAVVPPGGAVELDCSGVAFLDASGAQALVQAARGLTPARELIVVDPGAIVGRLLRSLARRTPSLTVVGVEDSVLPRAS